MWNPEEIDNIEDAAISARSLNELLDLMYISLKKMNHLQTERLLGLALNISSDISFWIDEEEKRREKKNTIEIYRRRIAIAALERMKHKTGSNCVIVNMPDGDIHKIDFDEKSMLKLLMRFERQACSEYGISESTSFIRSTYMNSLDINGHTEYLTETGKLIVDELLGEVITWAKEKYFSGGIN